MQGLDGLNGEPFHLSKTDVGKNRSITSDGAIHSLSKKYAMQKTFSKIESKNFNNCGDLYVSHQPNTKVRQYITTSRTKRIQESMLGCT